MEGKNRVSRQRFTYFKQIIEVIKCSSFLEMKKLMQNREKWRAVLNSL